jgi:hypothetical protein
LGRLSAHRLGYGRFSRGRDISRECLAQSPANCARAFNGIRIAQRLSIAAPRFQPWGRGEVLAPAPSSRSRPARESSRWRAWSRPADAEWSEGELGATNACSVAFRIWRDKLALTPPGKAFSSILNRAGTNRTLVERLSNTCRTRIQRRPNTCRTPQVSNPR